MVDEVGGHWKWNPMMIGKSNICIRKMKEEKAIHYVVSFGNYQSADLFKSMCQSCKFCTSDSQIDSQIMEQNENCVGLSIYNKDEDEIFRFETLLETLFNKWHEVEDFLNYCGEK